ncbi:MAG: helix-turn-helix domain-containing protein [Oscillospiraceae bacterium]|nr:helix-turn-helix domain-containing protein [Oscillospiraceae bacterium]
MISSFENLPSVLDVKDLAKCLHISRSGAYQLLHQEDFPTLHIARRLLVTKDNLIKWVRKNTNPVQLEDSVEYEERGFGYGKIYY